MITISSVDPLDRNYGSDQGTPIARFYIDRYMENMASNITGLVLEFGWPTYAQHCNCTYETIDINVRNKAATVHADICRESELLTLQGRYDWILCTALLQYVQQPEAAVANMHRMLKPGGNLILAEKAMSRIDPLAEDIDRWRFTQNGMGQLMKGFSDVSLSVHGNVYVACAYLYGMPAERVDADKLLYVDPTHPIVTIAHVRK